MKKAILWINLVVLGLLTFSGCSSKKDDPTPPAQTQKNMKFTITTTGLLASDDFDFVIVGTTVQGTETTLFKLNGVVQPNQKALTITNAQLRAGQVVIETTTPIFAAAISTGGFSATNGHSFTFKLEPVIDGAAQPVINKTITTTVYTGDFQYSAK
ncbi:hypothetical protein [Mucilaginibacter sp. RCC_168]|jgi:hypothetical protein|uniref:hypothetical protein n=1 Tax=unclassified Mucilaginibacter TaxID=2617802 RepID=UPI003526A66E